jgi:hypothetical protein
MKLTTLVSMAGIGVFATALACSSSSSPASSSGGGHDGGSSSSSSGSSSGGSSSSGSSSGSSGALPTITITSPTNGGTATVVKQAVTGEVDVPVTFTTTNFTGMPAEACPSISNNCGHVHLFVDPSDDGGASPCTPMNSPYNNASPLAESDGGVTPFSPMNAIMSNCANTDPINGTHTLRIELHSNNHAPINGADGGVIYDELSFTASGD